jgi:nicotinamide-nucleotide amidase
MTDTDSIYELARTLVGELSSAGKCVSTAESCTGGWIAKSLTDVSGSSQSFGYGVVSYSNAAKESMLGVAAATILEHGAVSEAVVREMATGVLNLSGADFSVAVSGVAGPDGGTAEKPVGTVWLAWAMRAESKTSVKAEQHQLQGDRATIRAGTVIIALQGIREMLESGG